MRDTRGVPAGGGQRRRHVDGDDQPGGPGARRHALDSRLQQGRRRDRVEVMRQRAQLRRGELVEVLHQARQPLDLLLQRRQRRAIQRPDAVHHRLHLAAQHGQRRAQLVGQLGDPAPPAGLQPLQRLGHHVDVRLQPDDLAGTAAVARARQAHVQLAGRDAPGRGLRLGQRPRPAHRQQPRHHQRHDEHAARHHGQAQVLPAQEVRVHALRRPRALGHAQHRHRPAVDLDVARLAGTAQHVAPSRQQRRPVRGQHHHARTEVGRVAPRWRWPIAVQFGRWRLVQRHAARRHARGLQPFTQHRPPVLRRGVAPRQVALGSLGQPHQALAVLGLQVVREALTQIPADQPGHGRDGRQRGGDEEQRELVDEAHARILPPNCGGRLHSCCRRTHGAVLSQRALRGGRSTLPPPSAAPFMNRVARGCRK